MSCGCAKMRINVPENTEWGPTLWTLLHGMAARAGKHQRQPDQEEEKKLWKNLFQDMEKVIICLDCRAHYHTYLVENPIVFPEHYSEFHEYVKRWVYTFHEAVNARLGKPSFPYEKMQTSNNLLITLKVLSVVMQRGMHASAVSILSWQKWTKHVRFLLSYYT